MNQHANPSGKKMPTVRYDSQEESAALVPVLDPERIREVAERYRIPLYEDPGVIEALARLDMSSTIPLDLYGVIAEVLGFVYRLDRE